MQNKPNFPYNQLNASAVVIKEYENSHLPTRAQNKPNQTQLFFVIPHLMRDPEKNSRRRQGYGGPGRAKERRTPQVPEVSGHAGFRFAQRPMMKWIPAFAGMTGADRPVLSAVEGNQELWRPGKKGGRLNYLSVKSPLSMPKITRGSRIINGVRL
jgi:hypothetical protein